MTDYTMAADMYICVVIIGIILLVIAADCLRDWWRRTCAEIAAEQEREKRIDFFEAMCEKDHDSDEIAEMYAAGLRRAYDMPEQQWDEMPY